MPASAGLEFTPLLRITAEGINKVRHHCTVAHRPHPPQGSIGASALGYDAVDFPTPGEFGTAGYPLTCPEGDADGAAEAAAAA